MAAAVPTGINIGVSILPWSVSISPARALVAGAVCCKVNFITMHITHKDTKNNCELSIVKYDLFHYLCAIIERDKL